MSDDNIEILKGATTFSNIPKNAKIGDKIVYGKKIDISADIVFPEAAGGVLDYNCIVIQNILGAPIDSIVLSNTGNNDFFTFINQDNTIKQLPLTYSGKSTTYDFTSVIKIWIADDQNILKYILQSWDPLAQQDEFYLSFSQPFKSNDFLVLDFSDLQMIQLDIKKRNDYTRNLALTIPDIPCVGNDGCNFCSWYTPSNPSFECFTEGTQTFKDCCDTGDKCDLPVFLKSSPYYVNINVKIIDVNAESSDPSGNGQGTGNNNNSSSQTQTFINYKKIWIEIKSLKYYIILFVLLCLVTFVGYKIYQIHSKKIPIN